MSKLHLRFCQISACCKHIPVDCTRYSVLGLNSLSDHAKISCSKTTVENNFVLLYYQIDWQQNQTHAWYANNSSTAFHQVCVGTALQHMLRRSILCTCAPSLTYTAGTCLVFYHLVHPLHSCVLDMRSHPFEATEEFPVLYVVQVV